MSLRFLTAGESHGPALVAILEGLPAGLSLTTEAIDGELRRRQQGYGAGARMHIEQDTVQILAGVMEGITTGAPLAMLITNRDHKAWQGKEIPPFTIPRPGHADLVGAVKYGYKDLRPALERASARETAVRVAVGAVCKKLLTEFGISVGGYVVAIGEIEAEVGALPYNERFEKAELSEVRCPSTEASAEMQTRIARAMHERDTVGGVIEVVALGLPVGLGSFMHWERKLDSRLGAALLSIPAIKGVEIGEAFTQARQPGTQAQDAIGVADGRLVRQTNHAGGLEGGVTNGEPLVIRAAMKPIATTLSPQASVDLATGEAVQTHYERSDFCPVPRAVPVVEAMLAYVLADALLEKLGGDSLDEIRPRFATLRQALLEDIALDGVGHIFWPRAGDLPGAES